MRFFLHFIPAVFLVICIVSLKADTIHVPVDQPTIQAGIDAAIYGDTVLVADGTYTGDGNRDIDFLGKAIVVMSEKGPNNCIIDCGGIIAEPHRGFYFHSGEDTTSVLQGFTIKNGYQLNVSGGGIYCNTASPTIKENIITQNECSGYAAGGGLYCENASPAIISNTITFNDLEIGEFGGIGGGGIRIPNPQLMKVVFS